MIEIGFVVLVKGACGIKHGAVESLPEPGGTVDVDGINYLVCSVSQWLDEAGNTFGNPHIGIVPPGHPDPYSSQEFLAAIRVR